jgi:putative sterol carrier protein
MQRFASLRPLIEPGQTDLDRAFKTMATSLEGLPERAVVQFEILSGGDRRYWSVELSRGAGRVEAGKSESPDLAVITRESSMRQIADGSVSPLEVFARGKMRLRGNMGLAKRLFKSLASPEGITEIC